MRAKIRLPRVEPAALCAGFGPERLAALSAVLGARGIAPRIVAPEELGLTVGALAGLDPPGDPGEKAPLHGETECLVLCGVSGEALDGLLEDLRRAGLYVPFKALLTPTNRGWRLDDLIGHLIGEHQRIAAARNGRP